MEKLYKPETWKELKELCDDASIHLGDIDTSLITNMSFLFANSTRTNEEFEGIETWDTSNVEDMVAMFKEASKFNRDISKWNTRNVKYMDYMFSLARSFNQPIGNWDVSNVTNMSYMFDAATSFNQDISSWDVSNVTDMRYMFYNAQAFNQDIIKWDLSSVEYFTDMFCGASSFTQDLSSWNAYSKAFKVKENKEKIYKPRTYIELKKLCGDRSINLGTIDTSLIDNMRWLFQYIERTNEEFEGIETWDTSNVTDMSYMFYNASKFNRDISKWDTSKVKDMSNMFYNAKEFNQPIGDWDVSNVERMQSMFDGAKSFNQDISSWYVGDVTDMSYMFFGAESFNQDISKWDVSEVEYFTDMFCGASSFNQDLSSWNVDYKVLGIKRNKEKLYKPSSWEELKALCDNHNIHLGDIDTSLITNMACLFYGSDRVNEQFEGIETWDTSNVRSMISMFEGATYFNQDISNWDVSNVRTMCNMFADASSFNQPLDKWNLSSLRVCKTMFLGASSFNQDLSSWNLDYRELGFNTPSEEPTKEKEKEFDMVVKPKHYNSNKVETRFILRILLENIAGDEGFSVGNCIKYLTRHQNKNGLEDLKKAIFYSVEVYSIVMAKKGKSAKEISSSIEEYLDSLKTQFTEETLMFSSYINNIFKKD